MVAIFQSTVKTNRATLSVLLGTVLAVCLIAFGFDRAQAYNGARLIDDSVFRQTNTMTRSQIRSFLTSKNSGIKDRTFTFNCASAGSQAEELYENAGAPCGKKVLSSDIIYYASKVYGLNPQVILATMQKEQSLITTTNPTSWQINQAMGYACPDSGGCGSSNFFYQIDNGAWVLRYHYERARRNMTWWRTSTTWTCGTTKNYYKPSLYPNVGTTFIDDNGVSFRKHTLFNAATSSLYCYTPHAYNNPKGLYGLPKYGTKGMYYTGSYNFVKFFNAWFGSTTSSVRDISFVGDWDGDGQDTLGIKRGREYLLDNNNDGIEEVRVSWGKPTDQVIVGDWDNDGKDEIGLKRGREYFLDTNNDGRSNAYIAWGRPTDQVIIGDWDNDGKDETGLKRGRQYFLDSNNDGRSNFYFSWGRPTDQVIVGDWNGNGQDTLGLKRGREYFLDSDNDGRSNIYNSWGKPTDKVIVGDWNGNGSTNLGLKRGREYFLDTNNDGRSNVYFPFGRATDKALVGDWNGNGTSNVGLKRYNNHYYYDYEHNSTANMSFVFGYY